MGRPDQLTEADMGPVDHRYLHHERSRHGKLCVYVRIPGRKRVRVQDPDDPESVAAAFREAKLGIVAPSAIARSRPKKAAVGSLDWLCSRYFASPEFARLNPKTRQVRRSILNSCCLEPWEQAPDWTYGDCPIKQLRGSDCRHIRDRKSSLPEAANGRLKAIRAVLGWALERDDLGLERNVALDVAYISTGSEGHHTWSIDEVRMFESTFPIGSTARLALALLLFTGQRRSDVVRLGRQHYCDGWLSFTQAKNAGRKPVQIDIPVLPELERIVSATPTSGLSFLETQFGRSFTGNGFGNRFRKWCDDAGLPNCSAHGLRKAGATIAAENGATEAQLMAIFGWSSLKEASRYTRSARRKKLAGDAMGLLVPQKMKAESA